MSSPSPGDVVALDAAVRANHPEPFHDLAEEEWAAAVDALAHRADGLDEDAFLVELMRLVALLGPRDGHSRVAPRDREHRCGLHFLPFELCLFEDGVHVVSAADASLVGARVSAFAGVAIDELVRMVSPLVAADSEYSGRARVPEHATCVEILRGLGVRGELDVDAEQCDVIEVPHERPPGYVDYPATNEACARAVAYAVAELAGSDRIVVDLRRNGGGDNTTYGPVLAAVEAASTRTTVAILVGRQTFSAAANLAAELAQLPEVTDVGEPTGGAPNQWGDAVAVVLPASGWSVKVATIYHERIAGDTNLATEPDVLVPLRAADVFAGRDAALEAAFAVPLRH
jgi:hypothetical protein